jgi:hypothetical protein
MSRVSLALAGLAILLSVGAADAQLFGRRAAPVPEATPDSLDPALCDQISSIPNSPMTPEACRSMMMMQQSMKAASADPTAVRPGDENMSCEQITAEMRAVGGPMVSQETAAQAKAAGDAGLALMQKQQAEAKAFVAGQVAVGIGASALGMVPGGGIAASAIASAQQAQAEAFAKRQQAEAAPVYAQSSRAITATTTEMGQAMQSNPRFARLMQLVADKNCPPPADLPPPTP